MQRHSNQEQDGVLWNTASAPLGTNGLDLRQAAAPGTLTKLINARFVDDRTLERRNGYAGIRLRDASQYPVNVSLLSSTMRTVDWVYGHGQLIDPADPLTVPTMHIPEPKVGRGVFRFENSDVAWTGDRLLVLREDNEPAIGADSFWSIANFRPGFPAYLPVVTDTNPPDKLTGDYVETCLTEAIRVVVSSVPATSEVQAVVIDRNTGAVLNRTNHASGGVPFDIRVFQSGSAVVLIWRDSSDELMITHWSGEQWTTPSVVDSSVLAFEVAPVDGGFHLAWRVGGTLFVGKYTNFSTQDTPYTFQTALGISGTPNGAVTIAAAPDGRLCVSWQSTVGLQAAVFTSAATLITQAQLSSVTAWNAVTACSRGLVGTPSSGLTEASYRWMVHAAESAGIVRAYEFLLPNSVTRQYSRFNSFLASKSFRVGNEIFCWLSSTNSDTLYLCGGVALAGIYTQVSGIADREEAVTRAVNDSVQALPMVIGDPLDEHKFTFARPYYTGQSYARAGNVRIGDMNFLPQFSAVQFGESVYLAGSHVRNWDGIQLGDAGFHDYPLVSAWTPSNGAGSLTAVGTYRVRAYAVRYNARGERFMSPALTTPAVTLTGAEDTITWTIKTVPVTNHSDVVIEVYRTLNGGTTYHLDGTVANTLTAATVQFVSTLSDSDLEQNVSDSHEPGVGIPKELEEFGPVGCELLMAVGDRLWGVGGQVPAGQVQFSKLKEPNEGAGFDPLASTQQIDTEGGRITSLVGFSDSTVIFQRDRIFVLFGTGPDNFGNGQFSVPQLILVDGAAHHLGTAITQVGVVYWASDGPRLLTEGYKVQSISVPVLALTEGLAPTGVQVDLARQEVVWFTDTGTAVLWNYRNGSRWAQWTGLKIGGCSSKSLVTTDGFILMETANVGDNGAPFEFAVRTASLRPEEILEGHTHVRRAGLTGQFHASHDVRFRVFYDGAPLWSEEFTWEPETETWLTSAEALQDLTPAQIDALRWNDHSGTYNTHKRLRRQTCSHFQVEISDVGAVHKTFTPHELMFELGRKPGLGRTAVNTFQD